MKKKFRSMRSRELQEVQGGIGAGAAAKVAGKAVAKKLPILGWGLTAFDAAKGATRAWKGGHRGWDLLKRTAKAGLLDDSLNK